MDPVKFGFGHAVRRKEDETFLRGAGRYVADYAPQNLTHAVVLRSPHAHARFRITDTKAARAVPGVRLVLTAEDLADLGLLPCQGLVPGADINVPPYPVLAGNEVFHVGDAIASAASRAASRRSATTKAIASPT